MQEKSQKNTFENTDHAERVLTPGRDRRAPLILGWAGFSLSLMLAVLLLLENDTSSGYSSSTVQSSSLTADRSVTAKGNFAEETANSQLAESAENGPALGELSAQEEVMREGEPIRNSTINLAPTNQNAAQATAPPRIEVEPRQNSEQGAGLLLSETPSRPVVIEPEPSDDIIVTEQTRPASVRVGGSLPREWLDRVNASAAKIDHFESTIQSIGAKLVQLDALVRETSSQIKGLNLRVSNKLSGLELSMETLEGSYVALEKARIEAKQERKKLTAEVANAYSPEEAMKIEQRMIELASALDQKIKAKSPDVDKMSPPAEKVSPVIEKTPPVIENAAPVIEKTPLVIENVSPFIENVSLPFGAFNLTSYPAPRSRMTSIPAPPFANQKRVEARAAREQRIEQVRTQKAFSLNGVAAKLPKKREHVDHTGSLSAAPGSNKQALTAAQLAARQAVRAQASGGSDQENFSRQTGFRPAETQLAIDLGAVSNLNEVRQVWRSLQNGQAKLVGGLVPTVTVTEITHGKPELRLLAGPVKNSNQVARICSALKKQQINCRPALFEGTKVSLR